MAIEQTLGGEFATKDAEKSVHSEIETFHVNSDLTEEDISFLKGFSDEDRKRVLRKLDWRLVPMLAFLYLIAYLDRANIGNAKIEGLMEDLELSGSQYNIALSIFFVPYILLEVPSNQLLLRFKRPSTYLGMLVVSWGIVMTLTGIVHNFGGLVATRAMLGVCEAGFFPGAVFLISRWYLPNESQTRIALFYTASAMAGAFSGLLAYAIAKMDGVAGLAGWRWIFILEGIASVAAGIFCFFFLVDTPALSSRWLEPNEIRYLELRQLAKQGNSKADIEADEKRKWKILKSVLLDWQIYLQALVYWSNTAPNYGLKFTMPQIIKNMGFTSANAQLLTIPPYFMGAVSAYVSASFSDRMKWRMPFIVGAQLIVLTAFAILFPMGTSLSLLLILKAALILVAARIKDNIGICYFAVILACVGFYPINPGGNAWTLSNLSGRTKRAQGIAYMICLGNIGGIIGSYIYIEDETPKYPTGFGASISFAGLGVVACLFLEFGYWSANKKRARETEDEVRARLSPEQLHKMGDRSPLFRYAL